MLLMLLNKFITFLKFKMAAKFKKMALFTKKTGKIPYTLNNQTLLKNCSIELLAYVKEIFKIN